MSSNNRRFSRWSLGTAAFVASLGWAGAAHAGNYKVCLNLRLTLDDSSGHGGASYGEDFGIGTLGPFGDRHIRARGMYAEVWDQTNGQVRWTGFLDGNGCTQTFGASSNRKHYLRFQPKGYASSNYVSVYGRRDQMVTYSTKTTSNSEEWIWTPSSSSATIKVWLTSKRRLAQIYAMFAYTIRNRFRGALSSEIIDVYFLDGPCNCGGPCACIDNGRGAIGLMADNFPFSDRRKFVMAHEYGHINMALTGGESGSTCGSSHEMTSLENASCAAMEGWAHFVATDAWNDHDEGWNPGGVFVYPWDENDNPVNDVINVEAGNGGWLSKYANVAYYLGMQSPRSKGVELDWLRMWWDYHTENAGNTPGIWPTHWRLNAEIAAANGWNASNAWSEIYDGVLSTSGSAQGDRFRQASDRNGIGTPFNGG